MGALAVFGSDSEEVGWVVGLLGGFVCCRVYSYAGPTGPRLRCSVWACLLLFPGFCG